VLLELAPVVGQGGVSIGIRCDLHPDLRDRGAPLVQQRLLVVTARMRDLEGGGVRPRIPQLQRFLGLAAEGDYRL
jgi:hypothetical protein